MSSSSSSETVTENTTEQFDQRIGASDEALVISLRDGSTFELTDPGLIEAAGAALQTFERVQAEALGFAGEALGKATGLTEELLDHNRTEAAQALDQVIKAGVTVAIIAIGAWGIPKVIK